MEAHSPRRGKGHSTWGYTLSVIGGILAGVAVWSVGNSREAAWPREMAARSACQANLGNIYAALQMYRGKEGAGPKRLLDLVGPVLKNEDVLVCPGTGQAYEYDPTAWGTDRPVVSDQPGNHDPLARASWAGRLFIPDIAPARYGLFSDGSIRDLLTGRALGEAR